MIIVCSWCGAVIGEKEPRSDWSPTHGICGKCHKRVNQEIKEWKKKA